LLLAVAAASFCFGKRLGYKEFDGGSRREDGTPPSVLGASA